MSTYINIITFFILLFTASSLLPINGGFNSLNIFILGCISFAYMTFLAKSMSDSKSFKEAGSDAMMASAFYTLAINIYALYLYPEGTSLVGFIEFCIVLVYGMLMGGIFTSLGYFFKKQITICSLLLVGLSLFLALGLTFNPQFIGFPLLDNKYVW